MQRFRKATTINVPAEELERWHFSPGAFQRLTPPWERVQVVDEPPEIADGTRAVVNMKTGPFTTTWVAEHQNCRAGEGFTDVQLKGPFADWRHVHSFNSRAGDSSELVDDITYRLPLGFLGTVFGSAFVRSKLKRTFTYRHAVTQMDLERLATEPKSEPMTVLVTGATGMVGTALESFLRMRGHRIRRATRTPSRSGDVRWDPAKGELDLPRDTIIDAVVHLAGENIAGGRWNDSRKQRILESRRQGTRLLCEKLAALDKPPEVLVSASGVNYYATSTRDPQDESSPRGKGFLADVCEAWENESSVAADAGIRTVTMRFGVILSPAGGALAKMLPAFRLGVAGRLGSGEQRMAWIALDDVIDVIHRALHDDRYAGPINVVAPQSPTNTEFTKTLAKILHRPAIFPAPAFALKLALGREMADETLLADLSIAPAKLNAQEYPFRFPRLDGALAYMLGSS